VDYDSVNEMLNLNGDATNLDIAVLRSLELKIDTDENWCVKAGIMIGNQYVNNNCVDVEEMHFVGCDYENRAGIQRYDKNYRMFVKNNVMFWFEEIAESSNHRYILKGVTIRVKLSQEKKIIKSHFPQVIFSP
jgi:hypothetical protein